MFTGAAKPPRIVPESAMISFSVAQAAIADPVELTTRRSTLPPPVARVFTAVQVPPAGRLAVKIEPSVFALVAPVQATTALPAPSMPTSGAWAPTLRAPIVTGALQAPPGVASVLAWSTGAAAVPPCHTTTARPFAASATAASVPPAATVTGADQVCPLVLELTWGPVPVTAICAPDAFSAKLALPTPAGNATGADHVLAAWAGNATAALVPHAITKAGSATAPQRMNRDMRSPSLRVLRGHGFSCDTPAHWTRQG